MSTIDERVVRMKFDNASFEKGVSKTMNTIEKLKEKLLFKNSTKGFEDVQKAADNISFNHLSNSVDKLVDLMKSRTGVMGGIFEAVGQKIVGIVDNMTSKITSMVNQVTFDPITTGFQEYETQINAIQVIAANTGVLMNDVAQSMNMTTESVISSAMAMEYAQDIWNTGRFGNGVDRVNALGDAYKQVQGYVNKIAYGGSIDEMNEEMSESSTTMADIEDALKELNTYADKTIYNFTQMTQAIGTFTVAGVDLDTSVASVKGIANLAAFVGAGAQDTSRIMFQLAQGLNTGYINLQDWLSLEHSAGFSGKVFQDQLLDTARHLQEVNDEYKELLGTRQEGNIIGIDEKGERIVEWYDVNNTVDDLIEGAGSFRNSLKEGWLTTEVLTTTLHKFANDWSEDMWKAYGYTEEEINSIEMLGQVAEEAATKSKTFTQMWDAVTEAAQSTWTQTWEYVIGGFYEAQDLWTMVGNTLSDFIGSFGEARNAALEFWHDSVNGRSKALQGLVNVFTFLGKVIDMVRASWNDVFPSLTGVDLIRFTMQFHAWTMKLKDAEPVIQIIGTVLHTLFTILKAGKIVVTTVLSTVLKFLGKAFSLKHADDILAIVSAISAFIEGLIDLEKLPDKVTSALTKFFNIIKNVPFYLLVAIAAVGEFVKEVTGIDVGAILGDVFNRIKMLISSVRSGGVKGFFGYIRDAIVEIKQDTSQALGITDKLKVIYDKLLTYAKSIGGQAKEFVKDLFGREVTIQKVAVLGLIAAQFKAFFDILKTGSIVKKTATSFKGIFDVIKEGVGDSLEKFQDTLQSIQDETNIKLIWSIIAAIVALTAALVVLSTIDKQKLEFAASIMVSMLGGLIGLLITMKNTITGLPNNIIIQLAVGLFAVSAAIINLIIAIAAISFINYEDLTKGLLSIFLMLAMLTMVVKSFDHKRFRNNILIAAVGVNMIVSALYGLIGAIALMSFMQPGTLAKGIIAIGFMLAELVLTLVFLDGVTMGAKDLLASVAGVLIVAQAIQIMVASLMTVALLADPNKPEKLGLAMLSLVGLIGMIVISIFILSKASLTAGSNTIAVALAISIISQSIFNMVAALELIEKLKLEPFTDAMAVLALIFSMLTIMTYVAGHTSPGKALVVAVAVNLIVSAIYSIILAIQMLMLMDINSDKFKMVSEKIILALIAITAIALAMSRVMTTINTSSARTFAPRLTLNGNPIGGILTGLAALILSITAGLWLLVEALKGLLEVSDSWNKEKKEKLQTTLIEIVEVFKGVAEKIKEGSESESHPINDAIMNFIFMIIDDIVAAIVYLLKALTLVATAIGEAVVGILIGVLGGLAGVDLADYFESSYDGLDDGTLITNLEKLFISDNAPINKLIKAIITFIVLVIYGVGDAIVDNAGPIVAALLYLIVSILYIVQMLFLQLGTVLLSNIVEWATDEGGNIDWSDFITTFFDNWKDYWIIGFSDFTKWLKETIPNPFSVNWWANYYEKKEKLQRQKEDEWAGENLDWLVYEIVIPEETAIVSVEPKTDENFDQKMFDIGEQGGKQSESGFRKAWDIESPSKEAEKDGEFVAEGFENGLTNGFKNIDFENVISSVRDNMKNINISAFSEDGKYSSEVSAVLDLDNTKSSSFLSEMMSGFDNTIIGENIGGMSTDLAGMNSYMQDMNNAMANQNGNFYDDTTLINEIQGMRGDITDLNSAMMQLKVVMDTNALVGQLVGPMDAALGTRQVRQSRGN